MSYLDRYYAMEDSIFQGIRKYHDDLSGLLEKVNNAWSYEDGIYRFYHQSFKVYYLQALTVEVVETLKKLAPGLELNKFLTEIYNDGTGKVFDMDHNNAWTKHTRPIVEAFMHSRYFLEMAVKYGHDMKDLDKPPQIMPSGWAALLSLFSVA